jgi:hypothetical protein
MVHKDLEDISVVDASLQLDCGYMWGTWDEENRGEEFENNDALEAAHRPVGLDKERIEMMEGDTRPLARNRSRATGEVAGKVAFEARP